MNWIVATPEGNRTVPVDPVNIEAFTGGGLTAEQISKTLAKLPPHAVPAYLAALKNTLEPAKWLALHVQYSPAMPPDWPFWPAVLDPRPNQEETPDGSGGIRLVEIPEERRGPAPEPVEWWSADSASVPEGDSSVPWQDPAIVPLTDAGHAERIREALAAACEHIDAAFRSGLTVDVSRVQIETTFPVKSGPAISKARFHAEITRPL
jgi:hypothetical protein